MKYKCPECKRTIFNRRLNTCEFCSAELPAELLYSKEDIDSLDQQQSKLSENQSNSSGNYFGMGGDSSDCGDFGGCD